MMMASCDMAWKGSIVFHGGEQLRSFVVVHSFKTISIHHILFLLPALAVNMKVIFWKWTWSCLVDAILMLLIVEKEQSKDDESWV
jgi:hypothetical protein